MRVLQVLVAGIVLSGAGLARADEPKAPAKAEGFVGCSDTKLFHKGKCKWVKEIEKAGTRVALASKEEAIKKGYKACGDCKP